MGWALLRDAHILQPIRACWAQSGVLEHAFDCVRVGHGRQAWLRFECGDFFSHILAHYCGIPGQFTLLQYKSLLDDTLTG